MALVDCDKIEPLAELRGPSRVLDVVVWGDLFIITDHSSTMWLYDATGACVDTVNHIDACNVTGWGELLITVVGDSAVWFWEKSDRRGPALRSGRQSGIIKCIKVRKRDEGVYWAVAWDELLVVCLCDGIGLELWDKSGSKVGRLLTMTEFPNCLRLGATVWGNVLATRPNGGIVQLWNKASNIVGVLRHETEVDHLLAWGDYLATVDVTCTVRLWDKSGDCVNLGLMFGYPSGMCIWRGMLVIRMSPTTVRMWKTSDVYVERRLSTSGIHIMTGGLSSSNGELITIIEEDGIVLWGVPKK